MAEAFKQRAEFPPPRPAVTRTSKNPLDKSTIVSVYPQDIFERKYTIEPGIFHIRGGTLKEPGVSVIGTSSWWSYSGDTRPTLEIPNSSIQIAESIIRDLQFDFSSVDARPGLFFIPGEHTALEVKLKYQDTLNEVYAKQRDWFMILVRIADSLWARANGNPLCISDQMRLAAEELNQKDKPWMGNFTAAELQACFACGSPKNPLFPVCPTCKAVDPNHMLAKEIKFAG